MLESNERKKEIMLSMCDCDRHNNAHLPGCRWIDFLQRWPEEEMIEENPLRDRQKKALSGGSEPYRKHRKYVRKS